MRAICNRIVALVGWLCGFLSVTTGSLIKDKRGNLPPPSGGIRVFERVETAHHTVVKRLAKSPR